MCYVQTISFTTHLTDKAAGAKPMMFNLYSHEMFHNFLQKCRYIYEQGYDGSPIDKLLVYSGLANVCAEFTVETDDISASYNHSLQRAFSWLLMKTLATFPLLVPASLETLEALLLAVCTTYLLPSSSPITDMD